MDTILGVLNRFIKAEHGSPVNMESMWTDANVDSFGTTVIFLDLDEKYGCFSKEWFNTMTHENWAKLTIRDIIERIQNESA